MTTTTRFAAGDLVTLKTDKKSAAWKITAVDGPTITIVKVGRPPSIYTTMYVTESRLQRAAGSETRP